MTRGRIDPGLLRLWLLIAVSALVVLPPFFYLIQSSLMVPLPGFKTALRLENYRRALAVAAAARSQGPGARGGGLHVRRLGRAHAHGRAPAVGAARHLGGPAALLHPRARSLRGAAVDRHSGRRRHGHDRALSVHPFRIPAALWGGERLRGAADRRRVGAAVPLLPGHPGGRQIRDRHREGISPFAHRARKLEISLRALGADHPAVALRAALAHAVGVVLAALHDAVP